MPSIKIFTQLLLTTAAIALGIAVFTDTEFNTVLILSLLLLIVSGTRTAITVGIIGGILYETISPFPAFTVVVSLAITLMLMQRFLIDYVTHRSIFGVIAAAFLGAIGFEAMLFISSRIGAYIQSGFTPVFTVSYLYTVFERVIVSTALIAVVVFLVQQFSPKARGIILIRG